MKFWKRCFSKHMTFGKCGCCGTPWNLVTNHSTRFSENEGIFALCEICWEKLTPRQRLLYYWELWNKWKREDPSQWEYIREAVLNGK